MKKLFTAFAALCFASSLTFAGHQPGFAITQAQAHAYCISQHAIDSDAYHTCMNNFGFAPMGPGQNVVLHGPPAAHQVPTEILYDFDSV